MLFSKTNLMFARCEWKELNKMFGEESFWEAHRDDVKIVEKCVSEREKNKASNLIQFERTTLYPFKLLIPARMTSSTSSKLLAMTVQELMICFLTM